MPDSSPTLMVTIDTEEEGLWGGSYRRTGNTVNNIHGVPRFQQLCDEFGVVPTYLIDAPVVTTDWAVEILRRCQDESGAEIGTHVHPWCNPPLVEEISVEQSFLCNLPEQLQREKIEWLTQQIFEKFDRRPTSFRAGRYGLDHIGIRILEDLGYLVDSSVIPYTDYSSQSGPNFLNATLAPYVPDRDDILSSSVNRQILEVPVTVGFNRRNFERAHTCQQSIRNNTFLRKCRMEGLLDRSGLIRRIKLSPEQADASRMQALIHQCLSRRLPSLVLMFHSSSLVPGNTPYVRSAEELDEFFRRLRLTFEYCRSIGVKFGSLTEFARHWFFAARRTQG